jgi:nitrate reductase cytochrome c-type subunit
MCHQPGQPAAQATEPAQTPAAPAATAVPTETETPAASDAPGIPHAIEGQENQCLACHYTGSIEPFPADHESFTNPMCLSCHSLEG